MVILVPSVLQFVITATTLSVINAVVVACTNAKEMAAVKHSAVAALKGTKLAFIFALTVTDHFVPIAWQRISRTIGAIIRTALSA